MKGPHVGGQWAIQHPSLATRDLHGLRSCLPMYNRAYLPAFVHERNRGGGRNYKKKRTVEEGGRRNQGGQRCFLGFEQGVQPSSAFEITFDPPRSCVFFLFTLVLSRFLDRFGLRACVRACTCIFFLVQLDEYISPTIALPISIITVSARLACASSAPSLSFSS